jgi:hypothetical protein
MAKFSFWEVELLYLFEHDFACDEAFKLYEMVRISKKELHFSIGDEAEAIDDDLVLSSKLCMPFQEVLKDQVEGVFRTQVCLG